jgi:HEAT repeat protein
MTPRLRSARAVVVFAALLSWPASARAQLTDDQLGKLVITLREAEGFKVRLQAAVVLGRSGGAAAVPPLVDALGDREVAVRGAAAIALGNLRDLRAVEALTRALDDEDGFVRSEAKGALAKLAMTGTLTRLPESADASERARLALVEVFSAAPGPAATGALVELLSSEPDVVRLAARQALNDRPPADVNSALRDGLRHPEPAVRQRSAELLGIRQDEAAVPRLAEIYADLVEVDEVRLAARQSLASMRAVLDPGVLAIQARTSADKRERARAVSLLGLVGGERAFRVCVSALNDGEVYVRGVAAMALAEMGDKRAIPELRGLLDRPANSRILKVLTSAVRRLERT